MTLHESAEMYLETIYILTQKNPSVRSVDVSEHMGYSKPSVSRAIGLLKQGGYLTVERNGFLTLTDTGRAAAEKVFDRHMVLSAFLRSIGVSESVAAEDACKVEHVISDETFAAIKRRIEQ